METPKRFLLGANSLFLKLLLFQKVIDEQGSNQAVTNVALLVINGAKSTKCIQSF